MKKLFFIIFILFIVLCFLFQEKIREYNYLRSVKFVNEMASLEFCILGFSHTHDRLPTSFREFLPNGEDLLPDDHPDKPGKDFYKLNIEFLTKDTLLIIYLHGFDGKDNSLNTYKNVRDLNWIDIFTFKGDLVVDSLIKVKSNFENAQPPPNKIP